MAAMDSPDATKDSLTFPIVCIGGSAGALPAYVEILRQIPVLSGSATVIVSHRALGSQSTSLLELLARAAAVEVVEVTDGMLLEPDRIFVAPPHKKITTDGVVLILADEEPHGWPTLISDFLVSLASTCRSRATAIILSGMGHDGSSALAAIKQGGGRTFAQSDADYPHMPDAAVATNCVDFTLSAHRIGKHLASLNAPPRRRSRRRPRRRPPRKILTAVTRDP
jgi:chemotaxis response regulator CheB